MLEKTWNWILEKLAIRPRVLHGNLAIQRETDRWRIVCTANGESIALSERYSRGTDARRGGKAVAKALALEYYDSPQYCFCS